MPRRVLVQRADQSFDLVEVSAPNEHHLQEIMKSQPQLIPAEDLGLDGDLLVVGRETALASGYIDLLCVARSGDVVLIEFKTGPQNPDFRAALAQLLDYGSDLWQLTAEAFDRGVVQRYLRGDHVVPDFRGAVDLDAAIERTNWDLSDDEREAFDGRLAESLESGDFLYVVASQRFTPAMLKTLEYLNHTMASGRFFLVELVKLEGKDLTAHAAQVVAAPSKRASRQAGTGPGGTTSEEEFLATINDPAYRDALTDLLRRCESLGIEVKWRTRGLSFRITTVDRRQPLAIGWVLPAGSHWHGAKNVSFGVDLESLAQTPSVKSQVLAHAARMKAIPGAKPVASLDAASFDPEVLPRVLDQVTDALEELMASLTV